MPRRNRRNSYPQPAKRLDEARRRPIKPKPRRINVRVLRESAALAGQLLDAFESGLISKSSMC